jgi:toxin ParE1/3/4
MSKVVRREAAKRDLIQRWVWYAENASVEIADRFLLAANDTLKDLARQPLSGQAVFVRSSDLQGMRRVPVGDGFEKTLLFYLPLSGGVDLIRVLHGSQDLAGIFDTPSR